MRTLLLDARHALRTLVKSPGFTAVAVLALALGIGANTAIFSVINSVLLRPLPYREPDRLVFVMENFQQQDSAVSFPNFADWREQNRVFEELAASRLTSFNLTGAGEAERLQGRMVTANFFEALGVEPAAGRDFTPEEDRPGGEAVAVLSHGFWQRRLGGDPKVVGRQLLLNGRSHTVVGVAPAGFEFYTPVEVFVPLGSWTHQAMGERGSHPSIYAVGRLKEGVTLEQARAEMDAIMERLAEQYPTTNQGHGATLIPVYENVVGGVRPALMILLGAVAFVLLIACANVANLLLARSSGRRKELAVRAALGATRGRIVRQLLVESVLLALLGGAAGLLLALWGTDLLTSMIPDAVPRPLETGVNARVLGFTLLASLLTGVIFGSVPALQASNPDLNDALREGTRGSTGRRSRLRNAFVVSEVALALVLLVGAGLMVKSFAEVQKVEPGFDPQKLLTAQLSLSAEKYPGPKAVAFLEEVRQRIGALPGVESAAFSNGLPIYGAGITSFLIEGQPRPAPGGEPTAVEYVTTPGYFRTMGIPLLKGRYLDERDTRQGQMVALVDEDFARRFFPGEDPLGKRVKLFREYPAAEIVGVVGHVKHFGLDAAAPFQAQFYFALAQLPDDYINRMTGGISLVVRTKGDPAGAAADVRREVFAVDKEQPVYQARTMEDLISESLALRRFSMSLLALFAAVAALLAAVGIYGVMSYSVSQHTRELGIRMALGAEARDMLWLVIRQGMGLALVGVGLGLAGALALTRVMSSLLYGVTATDPATFAAVTALLTAAALLACYVPARRATKVDPMEALRYE
ncbi:MAG TPA: ABC transporter permease [Pyrinomonadaceae bacterium]|nr:ABC transporter permease [Pyrinomonadaceae bacterium]